MRQQARHAFEQRRLPRAVRTDHAEDLGGMGGEGDVGEHIAPAPAGRQTRDGDAHSSCQRMVKIFHSPPLRTSWKLLTPCANGFASSDLLRDSYALQTCAMLP